jgi:hypothetical protein
MRWTRLTLGGEAAHGVGGEDALSRTALAYGILRGMYADGDPGQPPGVINPDS